MPLGADGAWQPYVSGGGGAISLRSGDLMDTAGNALNVNASRFGSNVGAGVMAFVGHLGFKGDVRYYRASGAYQTSSSAAVAGAPSTPSASPSPSPTPSPAPSPSPTPSPGPGPYVTAVQTGTPAVVSSGTDTTALGNNLLAGLAYWRANIGVAFRW
jgi:hypothetical protein